MKIAIISICSEEYAPLSDLTSKQEYAARHGYELFMCEPGVTSQKEAGYDRMRFALNKMEDTTIDWVWLVGVDCIVMNQTIKLESFLPPEGSNQHLVISHDGQCLNGDSVLVRNSELGQDLIWHILDRKDDFKDHHWADSWQMTCLKGHPFYGPMIRIIPQKSFNSYPGFMYPDQTGTFAEFTDGDFLIHFPGVPLDRRIELAREFLPRVLR